MKRKIILGAIFPLILGTLIYLIFRPTTIRFIKWTKIIENNDLILDLRNYFSKIKLPDWFIYNLPDGLWVFGLTFFLTTIWATNNDFKANLWKKSPIIIAVLHEFAQINSNISGTFDIMDIFFYLIGFLLSLLISSNFSTLNFFNHEQIF